MNGRKASGTPAPLPRPTLFLLALVAVALALYLQFLQCIQSGECNLTGDFDPFWRAAKQAIAGQANRIYDIKEITSWAPSAAPQVIQPFLNPPQTVLLTFWLGFLPFNAARILWQTLQALLLFAALRTDYVRNWSGQQKNQWDIFALLFPFVMLTIAFEQTGMWNAAFFLMTLALRKSRPLLAGLALAMLSIKPQAGLVLPLLLVKEKNWKALASAACATAGLILLSLVLLGTTPWKHYFELVEYYETSLVYLPPSIVSASSSGYMALRMVGLPHDIAIHAQAVITFAVLLLLWRALARTAQEHHRFLLLATANFLISPYSQLYDMVIVGAACLPLFRLWKTGTLRLSGIHILVALTFVPVIGVMVQTRYIPYAFVALCGAFWIALTEPRLNAEMPA